MALCSVIAAGAAVVSNMLLSHPSNPLSLTAKQGCQMGEKPPIGLLLATAVSLKFGFGTLLLFRLL